MAKLRNDQEMNAARSFLRAFKPFVVNEAFETPVVVRCADLSGSRSRGAPAPQVVRSTYVRSYSYSAQRYSSSYSIGSAGIEYEYEYEYRVAEYE